MKAKKKSAGHDYTVVGYYADNLQPMIHWVKARSPHAAALKVLEDRQLSGGNGDQRVVDVFPGKLKGRLSNDEVLFPNYG